MSNILEEYLVRIGAEVDKDAFAGAAQAISKLSGMLGKLGWRYLCGAGKGYGSCH